MKVIKYILLIFLTIPVSLLPFIDISQNGLTKQTGSLIVVSLFGILASLFLIHSIRKENRKAADREEHKRIVEKAVANHERYKQNRIIEIGAMTELPVVPNPAGIILKPNEICCFQVYAAILVIKKETVGRTASSGGISVRVAKGVTVHSGSTKGVPIKQDIAYTFPGYFSMTNQRFIMTGEMGFELPISRLTSLAPYNFNGNTGITLQFGGKSYTILMPIEETYYIPKIIDLLGNNV